MEVTRRGFLAGTLAAAVPIHHRRRATAARAVTAGAEGAVPVTIVNTGSFNLGGAPASPIAGLASATGAVPGGLAGLGTVVGAYIDEAQYSGGLTHAQAITAWQSNSGRTMGAERLYEGINQLPSSIPANAAACVSAGRICILSFKPFMFGFASPLGGGTSQASLDTSFNTCMAGLVSGGLTAGNSIIPLWHEPITTGGIASSADYIAMFQHYAPLVHSHGLITAFVTSSGTVWSSNENSYFPGAAYADVVATDYYFPQYGTSSPPVHPLGSGLSTDPAKPADDNNLPFGIFEFNNSTQLPIGTNGCTQTQATAYWHYLRDYFAGRLHAKQLCAPLVMFNSNSGSANPRDSCVAVADGVTDPYGGGSAAEYRNALIADLIDSLAAVT